MKKLLSLALALMLLLGSTAALAETEGYTFYQHPTLGYTLEYPGTWLALDSANFEVLMTSMSDDEALADLDLASVIPLISQQQMTMFMELNGTNVNIVAQDVGMSLTAEQFLPMMPQMGQQVIQSLPGATLMDSGSLYEVNGKQYCKLCAAYELSGSQLYAFQFYGFSGTTMILVTLTLNAASDVDAVEAYTDHMLATLSF